MDVKKIIESIKCLWRGHEFKVRKLRNQDVEVRICKCGLRQSRRFREQAGLRIPLTSWKECYE